MLTEKDYCDKDTAFALQELGYNPYMFYDDGTPAIHLWYAQKWLREEKGVHITPRIHLYHDTNLDEKTSWECDIYIEWTSIYTIGKSLTYEEALLLGVKETVKILKEK